MDTKYIEDVASSLVREYLSRKGLKMTLQVMDEEMPRGDNSISNRLLLMKAVHLERLIKRNKDSPSPFKAMLEVMAKYFIDKAQGRPTSALADRPKGQANDADDAVSSAQMSSTDVVLGQGQPGSRALRSSTKQHKGTENADIVIDDDVEGETLLGDGRAGLMVKEREDSLKHTSGMNRPKSKMRGMPGPIASNTEDRDRRSRMGRLKSATKPTEGRLKTDGSQEDGSTDTSPRGQVRHSNANTSNRDKSGRPGSGLSSKYSSSGSGSAGRAGVSNVNSMSSSRSSVKNTDSQPIMDVLEPSEEIKRPGTSRLQRNSSRDLEEFESVETYGGSLKASENMGSHKLRKDLLEKKDDALNLTGVSLTGKSGVTKDFQANLVNSLDAKPKVTKVGDLEFGDFDDLDNDVANLDLRPRVPMFQAAMITDSKPIDIQTAVELKQLVLGSASQCFSEEWLYQSFTFCDLPRLQYGIVQKKGGPCGVLASVQACMLQELLFGEGKEKPSIGRLEPSRKERSEALAIALATMFWRAGGKSQAVVTIPSNSSIFIGGGRYRPDNLTETLVLNHFKNFPDLRNFMKEHVAQFEMDGHSGVVLTLYSSILSRTIPKVREDMDEPAGKLMGQHGYCTQDMVNLLMSGHATSNVFNDTMELDGEITLKGVTGRGDVGLLSLFEHYDSCQVGTYYKTPKNPIWVICSESHFSVLFCLRKDLVSDWRAERYFDLYYYDGLGRQVEEIRLSISTINDNYQPPTDEDLTPPLELCIRTKWSDAEIDWNGTEPLL